MARARVAQALDRLPRDPDRQDEERAHVDLRRQHLGPAEAEGPLVVGCPAREPRRHQRQAQRGRVGEHVARVGDQRQRPGQPAADRLGHHDGGGEAERDGEAPHAGRAGRATCAGPSAGSPGPRGFCSPSGPRWRDRGPCAPSPCVWPCDIPLEPPAQSTPCSRARARGRPAGAGAASVREETTSRPRATGWKRTCTRPPRGTAPGSTGPSWARARPRSCSPTGSAAPASCGGTSSRRWRGATGSSTGTTAAMAGAPPRGTRTASPSTTASRTSSRCWTRPGRPAPSWPATPWACRCALEVHRRAPERVAALVLVCGAPGHPLDTFHDSPALKLVFPYARSRGREAPDAGPARLPRRRPDRLRPRAGATHEVNRARVRPRRPGPLLRGPGRDRPAALRPHAGLRRRDRQQRSPPRGRRADPGPRGRAATPSPRPPLQGHAPGHPRQRAGGHRRAAPTSRRSSTLRWWPRHVRGFLPQARDRTGPGRARRRPAAPAAPRIRAGRAPGKALP